MVYNSTDNTHNKPNITVLDRFKREISSETGEHRKDKNGKLIYEAGLYLYPNPARQIEKLEAFSTNNNTMGTTNDDKEEWNIPTNIINMNHH